MQAVVTDAKFHAHDPTAMLKALDHAVKKCPQLAGFWNWDNAARMRTFSSIVVQYIKRALVSKQPRKLAYVRLLVVYLKKNNKFKDRLNVERIAEMVYDLAVERYKQSSRSRRS